MTVPSPQITELLQAWSAGDQSAVGQIVELVYPELHRMAKAHLYHERPDHSIQATALVNEAYLRLVKVREVQGLAAVDRFNMAPAVEITANLAPGVSVGQARTLCEFQARELQRELRMEQAYELIWLQGMPPPE